jgi:hypothetical protein
MRDQSGIPSEFLPKLRISRPPPHNLSRNLHVEDTGAEQSNFPLQTAMGLPRIRVQLLECARITWYLTTSIVSYVGHWACTLVRFCRNHIKIKILISVNLQFQILLLLASYCFRAQGATDAIGLLISLGEARNTYLFR